MNRRSFFSTFAAALGALAFWRKPAKWTREYGDAEGFPEQYPFTLPEPVTAQQVINGQPYWFTVNGVYTLKSNRNPINIGGRFAQSIVDAGIHNGVRR